LEESTVDQFLEMIKDVNGQRLYTLPKPEMWCRRSLATKVVKGEPDIIHIGVPNMAILCSINSIEISLLAMVEVKPEQLMSNIIQGIITEQNHPAGESELCHLYNIARGQLDHGTNNYAKYKKLKYIVHQGFRYMVVNDCQYGMITTLNQIWFMRRDKYENASALYILQRFQSIRHTQTIKLYFGSVCDILKIYLRQILKVMMMAVMMRVRIIKTILHLIRKTRERNTLIITHHVNVKFHHTLLEEIQEWVLKLRVRLKAIILLLILS
jgi:hypothetical protein